MLMKRVSLAGLLGFIGMVAVGLAALVNATDLWVGAVLMLTIGLLLGGLLGVILRGRREAAWVGFVVFGWGFFFVGLIPNVGVWTMTLSDASAGWVFRQANSPPPPPVVPTQSSGVGGGPIFPQMRAYLDATQAAEDHLRRSQNAPLIGQWLLVLLYAQVGAIVGGILTLGRTPDEATVPSTLPSP
jgi:MFS family permease